MTSKEKLQQLEDKRARMVDELKRAHIRTDKIRRNITDLDLQIKETYTKYKRELNG